MERKFLKYAAACAGLAWAASAMSQAVDIQSDRIMPSVPGQIGTSVVVERNGTGNAPRVGVLAYCTDMAPNAASLGLMGYQRNSQNQGLGPLTSGVIPGAQTYGGFGGLGTIEGGWGRQGQFGAQNLADMLMYDDGIPRFRDVVLIDGDRAQPTAAELARNFDCVIAFTDNKCGVPIPAGIATQAGNALAGFAQTPGKGVVLTGFAFSSSIGFGDAIFAPGLSPLRRGGPGVDVRCSRPMDQDPFGNPLPAPRGACGIGSCAGLTSPVDGTACTGRPPNPGEPALCLDAAGNQCGLPSYSPFPTTPDFACDHMLSLVDGPTGSSWATALTPANVAPGATLCFNYSIAGPPLPLLAINRARNIVAVNTYPPDANDINKFWYQCLIGNAVQYACGNRTRCNTPACH